jgi:hypothetical protein
MKQHLVPVALLLVVGAGLAVWLVGRPPRPAAPPLEDYLAPRDDGPSRTAMREEGPSPGSRLAGRGAPPGVRGGEAAGIVRPQDLPRGGLRVQPVGEDGQVLPPSLARVEVRAIGPAFHAPPLGIPDPESGLWTFHSLIAGEVRVVVAGDHLVEASEVVEIRKDEVAEVTVTARPGGAIRYSVLLASGETPERVTLTLLEQASRRPVEARWLAHGEGFLGALRTATSVTQAPQGTVSGIPPGAYWLRATSPAGEIEEGLVEVRAGESVAIEVRVRR